jgi:hypothetical protein
LVIPLENALAEIPLSLAPSIPVILYEDTREVDLTWPPKESKIIESISPEAESKDLFGEYEWEDEPTPYKENILVNKDGRKAIHTAILWNVTRIFGWEGYFWWELNKFVNVENESIKPCELCGKIIHEKKDKAFCSRKDNPDCYRKRKKLNKSREKEKKNPSLS